MELFLPIMRTSPLFAGMEEEEIRAILGCLDARVERYPKGAYLLRVGDTGQLFAEAFACSPGAVLNIAVAAEAPCTVLFLNVRRILTMCPTTCAHHSRMIRNLLSDLAGKNLRFTEKLTHMGQRTTREKLLSYLSAEAQRCGDAEFDIPYSRQQLADYLSVERSGLSAELCRMRDEGILAFHKNHFKLLATP